MAKEIRIYAHEATFKMSDADIISTGIKTISVQYGSNGYGCTLEHINELKNAVLNDYPNIEDKDIEVWHISSTESIRHARFTMLNVSIPAEDFMQLRAQNKIHIL